MSDVNQKIMERSSGNRVLNPDEQRYYLGTFQERVLITINIEDVNNEKILGLFSTALDKEIELINPIKVKISSRISEEKQMAFMTTAKNKGLSATIIEEKQATSPFGVIIFTDHAINRSETDLIALTEDDTDHTILNKPKKGFFNRLFGK